MLQIVTLLTVAITAAVWSTRRKVEMSEFEETHLRDVLKSDLARHGVPWGAAKWFAAKVPRAWL